MRRLVVAFLILSCLATPACAINDKLLHGAAGFAIQAAFSDPDEGALAAVVAGAAKEFYDSQNGGQFDGWDLAATAGGGLLGRWIRTGRLTITDNELRAAYWISSGVSLSGICNQQRQGYYELNPAVTAVWGEHPSFWEAASLNLGWGLLAELAYRVNPTVARWMWGGGTALAIYYMDYDGRHGIPGATSTWRISWTWKVGRDYGKTVENRDPGRNAPLLGVDQGGSGTGANDGGSVLAGHDGNEG